LKYSAYETVFAAAGSTVELSGSIEKSNSAVSPGKMIFAH
jgi:hypothetical protein